MATPEDLGVLGSCAGSRASHSAALRCAGHGRDAAVQHVGIVSAAAELASGDIPGSDEAMYGLCGGNGGGQQRARSFVGRVLEEEACC